MQFQNKTYRIFYHLIFIFLLGCEQKIDLDLPEYEERLVIDGRIQQGQPPMVLISESQDYFDPTNQETFTNNFISDAKVKVSDGTNEAELDLICSDNLPQEYKDQLAEIAGINPALLDDLNICIYSGLNTPAIFGEAGKNYTLEVQYQGKEYNSITSINEHVPTDSVFFEPNTPGGKYGYAYALISDPGDERNAYQWQARQINQIEGEDEDATFKAPSTSAFDDQFFNGLTFEFGFPRPVDEDDEPSDDDFTFYEIGDTIAVKFSTLDYDAGKVLIKIKAQAFTAGNPFATPADVPTNIEGGALGLWLGSSNSIDTLIAE